MGGRAGAVPLAPHPRGFAPLPALLAAAQAPHHVTGTAHWGHQCSLRGDRVLALKGHPGASSLLLSRVHIAGLAPCTDPDTAPAAFWISLWGAGVRLSSLLGSGDAVLGAGGLPLLAEALERARLRFESGRGWGWDLSPSSNPVSPEHSACSSTFPQVDDAGTAPQGALGPCTQLPPPGRGGSCPSERLPTTRPQAEAGAGPQGFAGSTPRG